MVEEKWASESVRKTLKGILTYNEAMDRGYTHMDEEVFAAHRTIEPLKEKNFAFHDLLQVLGPANITGFMNGMREAIHDKRQRLKFKEYSRMPVYYEEGRAGARILRGHIITGETTDMWVPMRFEEIPQAEKENPNKGLSVIEHAVFKLLAGDEKANVAEVGRQENKTLYLEQVSGRSLFSKTYFDFFRVDKEERKNDYKTLIQESIHIAARLTNELPDSIKEKTLEDKLVKFEQIGIKREEASDQYHTLKIIDSAKLDASFSEIFAPLQAIITEYEKNHPVWISDRSPKNKKDKNIDFNKIDYAALTTELTLIIDMVPGYFTIGEREEMLEFAVETWNEETGNNLKFDENILASYHAESFYRATLNAFHCIRESKQIRLEQIGSNRFFEYTQRLDDAHNYLVVANENLAMLARMNVITEDQAYEIINPIDESYKQKRSFVDSKEFAIDKRLYGDHLLAIHLEAASQIVDQGRKYLSQIMRVQDVE